MKKFLFTLLVIVALIAGAASYFLSDSERIKSQLNTELSAASGYQVDIQGDLNWQIFPSLGLAISNVKVRDEETQIHISKLQLGLSLLEITKAPESWTLGRLVLSEVRVKDADFRLQRFAMQDFSLGKTTPFQAQLVFLQAPEPSQIRAGAAPVEITGEMIYRLQPSKANPDSQLTDLTLVQSDIKTRIEQTPLSGKCTGRLQEVDGADNQADALSAYTSQLDCTSSEFNLNSLTWPESKVTATLANGRLDATLDAANGSIDIRKLKETLAAMSMLIGKKNYAESLPDMMRYQNLAVTGSLQNEQTTLDASIDNLRVTMAGIMKQSSGELDLKGNLTIREAKENDAISVGPALTDLPLPFYCKGAAGAPDCGPDKDAALSVAKDLIKKETKLFVEEKIQGPLLEELEDKLPEEFREGAKQLLNLFGR
ncbi:AsmA family protein [Pseudomonadales bacterium]|nr:AsmA family protein [Pseudomonadales bacterium]